MTSITYYLSNTITLIICFTFRATKDLERMTKEGKETAEKLRTATQEVTELKKQLQV